MQITPEEGKAADFSTEIKQDMQLYLKICDWLRFNGRNRNCSSAD